MDIHIPSRADIIRGTSLASTPPSHTFRSQDNGFPTPLLLPLLTPPFLSLSPLLQWWATCRAGSSTSCLTWCVGWCCVCFDTCPSSATSAGPPGAKPRRSYHAKLRPSYQVCKAQAATTVHTPRPSPTALYHAHPPLQHHGTRESLLSTTPHNKHHQYSAVQKSIRDHEKTPRNHQGRGDPHRPSLARMPHIRGRPAREPYLSSTPIRTLYLPLAQASPNFAQ